MVFKKNNDPKIVIRKIAITSVFLSLAIIFTLLSTFMPLPFLALYLNLNLSAIFLGILVLIVNFYYAFFATVITALVVFINPGSGQWVGVLVNFFSNFTFISFLYLINVLFLKKTISKNHHDNSQPLFNLKWHYFAEFLAVISNALILTILNGLFFTPFYWYVFNLLGVNSPWFIDAMNAYNNAGGGQIIMLGIPDYWSAIFALYMAFNLFNFTICSIGITAAKTFIIRSKTLQRFASYNLGGLLFKIHEQKA